MQIRPTPNYLRITWDQFNQDTKKLAKQLKGQSWKGILAITRGGLVPSNILGYELNIKHIDAICISSYDDQNQRQAVVLQKPSSNLGDGEGWIIVDDLIDTGKTGEIIKKLYPKGTFVTTYAKTHGKTFVDHYAVETESDHWILLPWDKDPEK